MSLLRALSRSALGTRSSSPNPFTYEGGDEAPLSVLTWRLSAPAYSDMRGSSNNNNVCPNNGTATDRDDTKADKDQDDNDDEEERGVGDRNGSAPNDSPAVCSSPASSSSPSSLSPSGFAVWNMVNVGNLPVTVYSMSLSLAPVSHSYTVPPVTNNQCKWYAYCAVIGHFSAVRKNKQTSSMHTSYTSYQTMQFNEINKHVHSHSTHTGT